MDTKVSPTLPEDPNWGWSQEREFIENLLCERFNFFLVVFGAVVAGVLSGTLDVCPQVFVIAIGFVICSMMAAVIWRTQWRLQMTFDELKKRYDHPVTQGFNRQCRVFGIIPLGNCGPLIGNVIPPFCCGVLVFLAVAACYGWLPKNAGGH